MTTIVLKLTKYGDVTNYVTRLFLLVHTWNRSYFVDTILNWLLSELRLLVIGGGSNDSIHRATELVGGTLSMGGCPIIIQKA
jgi:hypothetical protein